MSRAAKLTLAGTSLFAIGTVFFVHYSQQAEKTVCSSPLPFNHILPSLITRASQLTFTNFFYPGNARWRRTRYATATSKKRAAVGFRDAETDGGGIQEGAECALRGIARVE